MKRKGNFYKDIYNKQNIKMAILKASDKKHSRKNVIKVVNNIDYYVDELYDLLINKKIKLRKVKLWDL